MYKVFSFFQFDVNPQTTGLHWHCHIWSVTSGRPRAPPVPIPDPSPQFGTSVADRIIMEWQPWVLRRTHHHHHHSSSWTSSERDVFVQNQAILLHCHRGRWPQFNLECHLLENEGILLIHSETIEKIAECLVMQGDIWWWQEPFPVLPMVCGGWETDGCQTQNLWVWHIG